jgi:hypothetical protein
VFRQLGDDRRAHLDRLLRQAVSTEQQLFNAVHVGHLPPEYVSFVEDRVQELRAALTRLSTELHRRIGTTRSRQALIARFKQRAEWYDAARLRMLAEQPEMGGGAAKRIV